MTICCFWSNFAYDINSPSGKGPGRRDHKEDDGAWISAFFHLFTALHIVVAALFHSWPVPDLGKGLGVYVPSAYSGMALILLFKAGLYSTICMIGEFPHENACIEYRHS